MVVGPGITEVATNRLTELGCRLIEPIDLLQTFAEIGVAFRVLRVDADGLCGGIEGLERWPTSHRRRAESELRLVVIGHDPNRLAVSRNRLVRFPLCHQGVAELESAKAEPGRAEAAASR